MNRTRVTRSLAGLAGLAFSIGSPSHAAPQSGSSGLAGSANATTLAQSTAGGGGSAASALTSAESEIASPALGVAMNSASYRIEPSVVWLVPSLGTDQPIVLGVEPANGLVAGGKPVVVRGLNFMELGAGLTTVRFHGVSAANTLVTSDTTIDVTTPPGVDALGNSVGLTSVGVENAIGSSEAGNAFQYLPALELFGPIQVGKAAELSVRTKPSSLLFLFLGFSIPGVGVPAPPFQGQLAVTVNSVAILTAFPMVTGALNLAVPISNNPALVGLSVDLQALSVTSVSPPAGGFSNVLRITFFE